MKLKNFYYYTTVLILFFVIVVNLVIITKRPAQAQMLQAGGRLGPLIICAPIGPVPNPFCISLCCAPSPSNMAGTIIPFGLSVPSWCPPVAMPNYGPPISVASTGFQLLGSFITVCGVTTGVNVGSSL